MRGLKLIKGMSINEGIAFGKVFCYKNNKADYLAYSNDSDHEKVRIILALKEAEKELESLHNDARESIGDEEASFFSAQISILHDPEYALVIEENIKKGFSAPFAVKKCGQYFEKTLKALDDELMRERANDVIDVSNRIINILCDNKNSFVMDEEGIICARELTPGEILLLDLKKVKGFILSEGSYYSHTSIFLRSLDIPAIVIKRNKNISEGDEVIIDAVDGEVLVNPSEEEIEKYLVKKKQLDEEIEKYKGAKTITKDGREIRLYANAARVDDVKLVIDNDAEGIGLLRSEFLYLDKEDYPKEEELFNEYKKIVLAMKDKPVTIRTIDIGADKQADYFNIGKEQNPALGLRGIRVCLENESLFITQLRAIYRASVFGNVKVMFPMITSGWEIVKIKEICENVKDELIEEGIDVGDPKIGIMIETPAAALISEELAKEVDFFSVGTNDLTMYTLAADRENERVLNYYDSRHPAVNRLLKIVSESAKKAGIEIAVCGELAGEKSSLKELIEMGYEELSVAPQKILKIRKYISEMEIK